MERQTERVAKEHARWHKEFAREDLSTRCNLIRACDSNMSTECHRRNPWP